MAISRRGAVRAPSSPNLENGGLATHVAAYTAGIQDYFTRFAMIHANEKHLNVIGRLRGELSLATG